MAAKRSCETEDNLESSPGQQHNEPDDSSQPSTSQPQMQTRLQAKRIRILAKMAPPPGLRISDTNDDALRLILEELSLQELIPLRIICHWWKAIIEQICQGKRSLKLFNGRASIREYYIKARAFLPYEPALQLSPAGKFNDDLVLNPKKVTPDIVNQTKNAQRNLDSQFLVDLFPGITSLVIAVKETFYRAYGANWDRCFAKYDFTYLLSQWPNLETLVFTNFPMSALGILPISGSSRRQSDLELIYWTAISKLTSLKHLCILGNSRKGITDYAWKKQKITFAPAEVTLSQLQQFTYQNNSVIACRYFVSHLKNCTKLKLSLFTDFFTRNTVNELDERTWPFHDEMLVTIDNHLAANLTHLELSFGTRSSNYLSFVCDHFPELKVLRDSVINYVSDICYFDAISWRFEASIHQLAKLTKLTELWIPFKADGLFVPFHDHLPALASVKILRLTISTPASFVPSAQSSYQTLQQVFPGLEEVHVACRTNSVLDEAKSCFTNTFFPALKSTHFYDHPQKMLTPSAVQFMGQHASFLKKLEPKP